jgi:predicted polyphosphate/ATP-dependent NAD kinase
MILGLLVNPIAGMGGRVGLKGTDGVVDEAIKRGAEPVAPIRGAEFLDALAQILSVAKMDFQLITCPAEMGARIAEDASIDHLTLEFSLDDKTSAKDTKSCVLQLYKAGVRLLVFVGGDGTARDILDVVNEHKLTDLQVLGVPSGVKMYSGIFVINPRDAAEVIRLVAQGDATSTEFEIMDADEEAIRKDRFIIRLYGYLNGPSVPARFQGSKQASPETIDEGEAQEAIARHIIDSMIPEGSYILGPGTTVKKLTELLEVEKTTLGVDVYKGKEIYKDVNESKILEIIEDFTKAWIVVSPIGHQGMLFGRGNQQISPNIIEKIGKERIMVICTPAKLGGIDGGTLKVDTGDCDVDESLRGYIRVITDYNEIRMVKVE